MSPWLFNVYMDGVRDEDADEKGSEIYGGWEGMEIAWAFVCRKED